VEKPDYPTIFLVYLGDVEGWVWCDDPTPSDGGKLEDAIQYTKEPPWKTVQEFQEDSVEGQCFIAYKGRVLMAYHNHNGRFLSSEYGSVVYMAECISAVKFIEYPCVPKIEEVRS